MDAKDKVAPHGTPVEEHYNVPSGLHTKKDFWLGHGDMGNVRRHNSGRGWHHSLDDVQDATGKYKSVRDGTDKGSA